MVTASEQCRNSILLRVSNYFDKMYNYLAIKYYDMLDLQTINFEKVI